MSNEWSRLVEKARAAGAVGNYEYAEVIWANALLEAEEFGAKDERMLQTLQGLRDAYLKQGKFRKAEGPARQILEFNRDLHGNEHLATAMAANGLAEIFNFQQKYGQAEPLYKMALSLATRILGSSSAEVLTILEQYAHLLQKTYREAEADNLLRCLKQAQSGGTSINTAAEPVNNSTSANGTSQSFEEFEKLGEEAYAKQQWDTALEFWNQALNLSESFDVSDCRRCVALDRVGELLCAKDLFGQAEMTWGRSLQLKIAMLGPNHPSVAYTGNHLAGLHYLMGRYSEAESCAKKCLRVFKMAFGTNHPAVAMCFCNLASLYHVQARYPEAEQNYKAALTIRKKVFGVDHQDTRSLTKSYADLLKTLGRDREADELNSDANGFISGSWKVVKLADNQVLSPSTQRCLLCGAYFVEGTSHICAKARRSVSSCSLP